MSLGTSAALSKPLCALSEPLFGVCAACSFAGGVFGAQAGAAGEAKICCFLLVQRAGPCLPHCFRATSEGKLIQGGKSIIPRCSRDHCRDSSWHLHDLPQTDLSLPRVEEHLQQDWRTPGRDRSHGALLEQVRFESTAGRAGHSRTRSCPGIGRQQCQGHAADCSEGLHGGELVFPSSLTLHVTRLRTEHSQSHCP